jgi:hypothetical protein
MERNSRIPESCFISTRSRIWFYIFETRITSFSALKGRLPTRTCTACWVSALKGRFHTRTVRSCCAWRIWDSTFFVLTICEIFTDSYSVSTVNLFLPRLAPQRRYQILLIVRRLLLADMSKLNELEFRSCSNDGIDGRWFFDAESLAYLMEQCQSLTSLKLEDISLDEDQIRVFGDILR